MEFLEKNSNISPWLQYRNLSQYIISQPLCRVSRFLPVHCPSYYNVFSHKYYIFSHNKRSASHNYCSFFVIRTPFLIIKDQDLVMMTSGSFKVRVRESDCLVNAMLCCVVRGKADKSAVRAWTKPDRLIFRFGCIKTNHLVTPAEADTDLHVGF